MRPGHFGAQAIARTVPVKFDSLAKEGLDLFGEIAGIFDRSEDPQSDARLARGLDRFGQPLVRHDAAHPGQIILRLAKGHPAIRVDPVRDDVEPRAAAIGPQRLLVLRGYGEPDIRPFARGGDRVEHRPERGDMLRRHAGDPRPRAPFDDFRKQRIVVHHVIGARADGEQDALEGVALIGGQFAGPAEHAPWEYFVIRGGTDRHEAFVLRAIGGKKVDLVARGTQPPAQHVAMRFHSAPEGFGDGMANMGENGDFHEWGTLEIYPRETRGCGPVPES